jgi:hypothetical protein
MSNICSLHRSIMQFCLPSVHCPINHAPRRTSNSWWIPLILYIKTQGGWGRLRKRSERSSSAAALEPPFVCRKHGVMRRLREAGAGGEPGEMGLPPLPQSPEKKKLGAVHERLSQLANREGGTPKRGRSKKQNSFSGTPNST